MSRNDLRTLWQQSRNFRRLGGVIALLFLLYLLGKSAPVATPDTTVGNGAGQQTLPDACRLPAG